MQERTDSIRPGACRTIKQLSKLGDSPQHRGVHCTSRDVGERNPTDTEHFIGFDEILANRLQKEPDVIVRVCGPVPARWDQMDIDVENPVAQHDTVNTGLLSDFPNRRGEDILSVIDVAARLQPPSQLGVMDEKYAASGTIDNEGAGGDVSGYEMVGRQCLSAVFDQIEDRRQSHGLV